MRLRSGFLAIAVITFPLTHHTAGADVLKYQFFMDGPSESPPVASPGTGTALITLDTMASTMRVEAEFSGLIGNTTLAHIHCCALPTSSPATMVPTFNGFPAGVTSGSYDMTFDMSLASSWNGSFITGNGGTTAGAFAALLAGMDGGTAYFNIHTTSFGGGEIRGFAEFVPEPGSVALIAVSCLLTAPWWSRRLIRRNAN